MQSGDLSTLFRLNPVGPALPATFRQGALLDFDADDGSNSVGIGTSELTDLPLLVTGAEIGLEAGDNVLVMYLGNSAMIVGKIASVGGSNYGAGSSGRVTLEANALNFPVSAAISTIVSVTATVPGWAHSADITMQAQGAAKNGSGTADSLVAQVRASCPGTGDAFATGPQYSVTAGIIAPLVANMAAIKTVVPGQVLTCSAAIAAAHSWAATTDAYCDFFVVVRFYREDVNS